MTLSKERQRTLKSQAHNLKPTVFLGSKGLTQAVLQEIDQTLIAHELIKIKLRGFEREDKAEILQQICDAMKAELVQVIGHIATLYRENPEDKPQPKKKGRSKSTK